MSETIKVSVSQRKRSSNPIVDLVLRARYAIARGLRRAANAISPDNF